LRPRKKHNLGCLDNNNHPGQDCWTIRTWFELCSSLYQDSSYFPAILVKTTAQLKSFWKRWLEN